MIDEKVIGALRLKHSSVHPLLFQRSVEHATRIFLLNIRYVGTMS